MSDPEKGVLKGVVFYLNYAVERKYTRYETDFGKPFQSFHALFITPSQKRLQHMREAVTNLAFRPAYAKRLLWGTVQSQVTKDRIFESIWHSFDTSNRNLYRIG